MSGVCDTTAGDVLCGNVPDRDTGEIGSDVAAELAGGGEMGGGDAIFMRTTRVWGSFGRKGGGRSVGDLKKKMSAAS